MVDKNGGVSAEITYFVCGKWRAEVNFLDVNSAIFYHIDIDKFIVLMPIYYCLSGAANLKISFTLPTF